MQYYETDRRALHWFESALASAAPAVRIEAVRLLALVETERRALWLTRASLDSDPRVSAEAVLVMAALREKEDSPGLDLFESDFASGDHATDLGWEWEYLVLVCQGASLPHTRHLVWTGEEDDVLARRLALLKAFAGKEQQIDCATAIIVSKRFVTPYTRSPRSMHEAMRWRSGGRPRYRE